MHIYSKNGHTLVELMIVAGMMTVILAASTAMWVGSVRCYSNVTARTGSDMDAVAAMQMIVTDVREAKEAIPISSGKRLRVTLPRHLEGRDFYNRFLPDTANQIEWYLSDSTGDPAKSGTWLWRSTTGGRCWFKKNVVSLSFAVDPLEPQSVQITLVAKNGTLDGDKQTSLTQRVVYMRNY